MVEVVRHRRRRWLGLLMAIAVISAAIWSGAVTRTSAWPFDLRTVGVPCPDGVGDWVCGSIRVPLDRASPNSDMITVEFRILPRQLAALPSAGTLVVVNGGPGEPSMAQHAWAQRTFGSLLSDHDLLLVDNRGTGASDRINCPEAQKRLSPAAVAQCRTILGSRAGDYGTVAAADDLEAVLERVHARAVDLYGESYGTFFAQVFALRYPRHLQRLVLDGALPLDVDPWSRDSLPTGLAALRTTCRADPACADAGDPVALLGRVLPRLRVGVSPEGISRRAYSLALLVANVGRAGSADRELVAALRSYLAGDRVPLFRLADEAENGGYGSAPTTADTVSDGLFLADICGEQPQPFNLRVPLTEQQTQLDGAYKTTGASVARTVLPFTPREALRYPSMCLGWPAPTNPILATLGHHYPDVPTLVLEGGSDTVTPARGAREVASEFPDSRYVEVPFVGHVTALSDHSRCAASIATQFLASSAIDTGCLAHLSAPPVVDAFPTTFSNETPIVARSNQGANRLSATDGRTIAVVRDAVADVMWRWVRLEQADGRGLRGGTFATYSPDQPGDFDLHLDAIRWTTDTTVTGDITTYAADDSLNGSVDVTTPAGLAHLNLSTSEAFASSTVETITGTVDGHEVDVEIDAKLGL